MSFEKMENPPCPLVPEEEKYRVGLENRTSKLVLKLNCFRNYCFSVKPLGKFNES